MENTDGLITLVIHTSARAMRLKEVLEAHGINVVIEDIDVKLSDFSDTPKKVRINVGDLQLGLKILESGDLVSSSLAVGKMTGMGNTLLIPVDFSPSSILAVKVGFFLAQKFDVEPVILHSFIAPQFSPADIYENQIDPLENTEIAEAQEQLDFRNAASSQLSKFKRQVDQARKDGTVADIRFSTTLLEGIPEQVIQEYCRQNNPLMVVMSTRGIDKKESDLIGSVTAEVIDSCRVPVLTVPEKYLPTGVDNVRRIAMFCTFTGFDVVTLRGLMRTFDYPSCDVYLVPANESSLTGVERKLDSLKRYFTDVYPTARFHICRLKNGHFDDSMRELLDKNDIQLIIIPNKKSNAISRFFHPTLAHRILFERDIPLFVLPI